MLLWKYLKFCQGTGCEIPQNRRLTNDRTQQRREITLGVHCGQVEHQGLFLCGESPLTISLGNLQQIVTAPPVPGIVTEQNGDQKQLHCTRIDSGGTPPRPVSLLRCSRCLGQSPPGHCGGASAPPRRGDTQAPPGYFLPNHSSLFPKKPSPFHIGLYFEEVSAVESLSHGFAVPAPFRKGAFLSFPVDFFPGMGYTGVNQLNACLIA